MIIKKAHQHFDFMYWNPFESREKKVLCDIRFHYSSFILIIVISFWYEIHDLNFQIETEAISILNCLRTHYQLHVCNDILLLCVLKNKYLVYILLSLAFKWICLFCIIACSHNKIFVFWSSKISYVETRDKWTTEHRVRRPTSIWYSARRSFH